MNRIFKIILLLSLLALPAFSQSILRNRFTTTTDGSPVNGGTLFNLQSANLTGPLPNLDGSALTNLSQFGFLTPQSFGAKGDGVTDDTSAIQAAFNSGVTIIFPEGSNYLCGNLTLATGTSLIGNNSRISFNTASTGAFVSGSSTVSNVFISGILFDGKLTGFTSSGGQRSWLFGAQSNITQSASVQRGGILIPAQSPSIYISNCKITGFSAYGIEMFGILGTFPQPTNNCAFVNNNAITRCYEGMVWTNNAEYVVTANMQINDCGIAYYINSGNVQVNGGQAIRNGCAFEINGSGDANPGHGKAVGVTANHNDIFIIGLNSPNGYQFSSCFFLGGGGEGGGGTVMLTNCVGIAIQGGEFGGNYICADGGANTSSGWNVVDPEVYSATPTVVSQNSGHVLAYDASFNRSVNTIPTATNGWAMIFSNLTAVLPPTLMTTNSAPVNASTVARWFTITNNGAAFAIPGYQ